jgi:hypothetical protein
LQPGYTSVCEAKSLAIYLQLDPFRAEASAGLAAPIACAAAMTAFAAPQLPFRALERAADGALLRAACVHCAFFAASAQRPKLLTAPETFPEFAAAMHASQAALPLAAGGVVAGVTGVEVDGDLLPVFGVVGVLVGLVPVVSTGGTVPVTGVGGVGAADSSGLISVSLP